MLRAPLAPALSPEGRGSREADGLAPSPLKGTRKGLGGRLGRGVARSFLVLGVLVLAACAAPQVEEKPSAVVYYPAPPDTPRLQHLITINSEDDLGEKKSALRKFVMGETEEEKSEFIRPWDVAHEKGKLYVLDRELKEVLIIDLATGKFGRMGASVRQVIQDPFSIFIAENGYKYIADKGRGQVIVADARNEFFRAYGSSKQFDPVDVVVRGDRIYVADLKDHEVEILDRVSGDVVGRIGGLGKEEGSLYWPTHLALAPNGDLYVTDFLNFRIQRFDKDGEFVGKFGYNGDTPGATPRPKGVAVDREGRLYVVDNAFELVQIFDVETARLLLAFGKFETGPGSSWLPAGINIDYDNLQYFSRFVDKNIRPKYLVYVANQAGPQKLNVYAFGEWIGPDPKTMEPPAKAKPASE